VSFFKRAALNKLYCPFESIGMTVANGQFASRSYMSDQPTWKRAKCAATLLLVLLPT
jgi:hypothetical protein